MTRVSTANTYDSTVGRLIQRQNQLGEAQQQLTSGKRVNRPSDDPTAAGRAERALASVSRVDATQRGVDASRALMTQSESALGNAGELLQQAREALVAAGNGSYSDAERKSQAEHLRGLRQQLLAVANRSDGADGFLFAGQGSSQPPFIDSPGSVQYRGTSGEALVAGNEGLPISIDGAASWLSARTGNGVFETRAVASTGGAWIDAGSVTSPAALTGSTYDVQFSVVSGNTTYSVLKDGAPTAQANVAYSAGKAIQIDGMSVTISGAAANGDAFQLRPSSATLSVFDVLDKAVTDLSAPARRPAQITQSSVENLRNIDQVMSRLQSTRSGVGDMLNRIDGVTDRLASQKLQGQQERSSAEDLDMVQAISDFQAKQSGYDAALKSYSMVQRLSLFQYLNA